MTILDRYILRQFLFNFLILLVVFFLLIIVVDAVFNFDEFVAAGKEEGAVAGTLWAMWDYYGPMVPFLYVFFASLLVTAAMGFTFAGLSRSGELTAMVASGVSMYRLAMGVIIVGFVLNGLALLDQEFIIPRLAPKLTRSASEIGKGPKPIDVNYAVDANDHLLSAREFDPRGQTLKDVTILERSSQRLAERRITADAARWDDAGQRWLLSNGVGRRPDPGAVPARLGPGQRERVEAFATSLSPQVLLAQEEAFYPRLLSLSELDKLSRNPTVDTAAIRQIMWGRFSLLVMSLLNLIMGMPFFMRREPANMLLQGVKAAIVCVGAWAAGVTLLQVGGGGLNPVAAAWLPVVIYLPVSATMLLFVKT